MKQTEVYFCIHKNVKSISDGNQLAQIGPIKFPNHLIPKQGNLIDSAYFEKQYFEVNVDENENALDDAWNYCKGKNLLQVHSFAYSLIPQNFNLQFESLYINVYLLT